MAPKRDAGRGRAGPVPAPSEFLGTIPKKTSAAAAAKAAGAPKPGPSRANPAPQSEVRRDKRQRNSSGPGTASGSKKPKGYNPREEAAKLGARRREPSPEDQYLYCCI